MNEAQKKTAFMDSNALLRMFSFWEVCELAGTAMVDVEDWNKLKTAVVNGRPFQPRTNYLPAQPSHFPKSRPLSRP